MVRAWRAGGVFVVVALLAAGCGGSDSAEDGEENDSLEDGVAPAETTESEGAAVFPGDEWAEADPEGLGFEPDALDALAAEAAAGGADCLLVVRDGQVAGEWYWNGTDASQTHEAYSATKSYTSALVGIAQDEGLLDIDDAASEYIEEWIGTPSEDVTVRNILSNDSGRHSPGAANVLGVLDLEDATGSAIALEQDDPPGSVWSNNEAAIQTLDAVLKEATGEPPVDYAQEKLLDPIGVQATELGTDASGNTWMFWNTQTTCRDAARLGHLFLNDGEWDGTQVISEEYVEAAVSQPSQELNPGYGYLWWLNRAGTPGTDEGFVEEGDRPVPDAPEDMYWALGAFGQVIQVDPGSGTVITRFGGGDAIYDPSARDLTARIVTQALTG